MGDNKHMRDPTLSPVIVYPAGHPGLSCRGEQGAKLENCQALRGLPVIEIRSDQTARASQLNNLATAASGRRPSSTSILPVYGPVLLASMMYKLNETNPTKRY